MIRQTEEQISTHSLSAKHRNIMNTTAEEGALTPENLADGDVSADDFYRKRKSVYFESPDDRTEILRRFGSSSESETESTECSPDTDEASDGFGFAETLNSVTEEAYLTGSDGGNLPGRKHACFKRAQRMIAAKTERKARRKSRLQSQKRMSESGRRSRARKHSPFQHDTYPPLMTDKKRTRSRRTRRSKRRRRRTRDDTLNEQLRQPPTSGEKNRTSIDKKKKRGKKKKKSGRPSVSFAPSATVTEKKKKSGRRSVSFAPGATADKSATPAMKSATAAKKSATAAMKKIATADKSAGANTTGCEILDGFLKAESSGAPVVPGVERPAQLEKKPRATSVHARTERRKKRTVPAVAGKTAKPKFKSKSKTARKQSNTSMISKTARKKTNMLSKSERKAAARKRARRFATTGKKPAVAFLDPNFGAVAFDVKTGSDATGEPPAKKKRVSFATGRTTSKKGRSVLKKRKAVTFPAACDGQLTSGRKSRRKLDDSDKPRPKVKFVL